MTKYSELMHLAFQYKIILNQVTNKYKTVDISFRTNLLEFTSDNAWNKNISNILEKINSNCSNNFDVYPLDIFKITRELDKIFQKYYRRFEDFDYSMTYGEGYEHEHEFVSNISKNMHTFVYSSLEYTELLIDTIHFYHTTNDAEISFELDRGFFDDNTTNTINITYEEVIKNYINTCFMSAISLCGKIIETALYALYNKKYYHFPDENKDKLGINAIINRLKKCGYNLSSVEKQLEIIAERRNKAIHGNLIIPSSDEAQGVICFTRDVLRKVTSLE